MRPNPSDLDSLIQGARTDEPSSEAQARALYALRQVPNRRKIMTIPRIAVAAVALSLPFFLPLATPRSSGAWAQVAEATAKQERYHERIFFTMGGKTLRSFERWVDGKRFRFDLLHRGSTGKFIFDGNRAYHHLPGLGYATIRRRADGEDPGNYISGFGEVSSLRIDEMIRRGNVRPVGEPEETTLPEGKRTRYRVEYFDVKSGDVTAKGNFYVAEGDQRIRRWELVDHTGKVVYYGTIDYVNSIPDRYFAIEKTPGVKVYDLDAGAATLRKTIQKGFGTKSAGGHSVTLRALIRGTNNELIALWTGAPPNGDLQPAIKVDKVKVERPFGLSILTTKVYQYIPAVKKLDYLPTPLAGMGVIARKGVGKRVTVTLPVFAPDRSRPMYDFEGKPKGFRSRAVGKVTYRDVPVLEVGPFYQYLGDLALREPTRYEALVRDYGKPRE